MLKAYKIACRDPDHGAKIRFANTGKELKGCRGGECCDCEYIDRTVHRAKAFDSLAPGPVTVQQYLEHGWYWGCSGCDCQCTLDEHPLVLGDRVFCTLRCLHQERGRLWKRCAGGKVHESFTQLRDVIEKYLAEHSELSEAGCC